MSTFDSIQSLKTIRDTIYDTITNIPNDIVNIIVYGYLDVRKKCSTYHIPTNKSDKCHRCRLSYCIKCQSDITIISNTPHCKFCFNITSSWIGGLTTCSRCKSLHYANSSSINYCYGCKTYICTNCNSTMYQNIRCENDKNSYNPCYACYNGVLVTGHCRYLYFNGHYCILCFPKYDTSQKCTICNASDNDKNVLLYKCDNCSKLYCRECNAKHTIYPRNYNRKKYKKKHCVRTYCHMCFNNKDSAKIKSTNS
jgi:hypothetical protein